MLIVLYVYVEILRAINKGFLCLLIEDVKHVLLLALLNGIEHHADVRLLSSMMIRIVEKSVS
jgi:hypothetical protein